MKELIFLIILISINLATKFALADCAHPAGVEGEIVFNGTYNVPQYCDDTNWIAMTAGKPPTPACPPGIAYCGRNPSERVVFVSSQGLGALGGVAGADAHCQARAEAAGLRGRYLAWIAGMDPLTAPAYRFERSTVPYVRVTGEKIADDWDDLTDGTLDAPIALFGDGTVPGLQATLSNVAMNGTQLGATANDTCNDWTDDTGAFRGNRGRRDSSGAEWTNNANSLCNTGGNRPYCFEQIAVGLTEVIPDGLIGHWRLDEASGPYSDSSATSNSASLVSGSVTSASGVMSNSLIFDTGDRIEAPTNATYEGLTAFTITAWIYMTDYEHYRGIANIGNLGGFHSSWNIDKLRFHAFAWNTQVGVWQAGAATSSLPLNKWTHVAVSYDYGGGLSEKPSFYVNGVPDTNTIAAFVPTGSFVTPASSPITIGSADISGFRAFHGNIDDVRVYNRILSDADIKEIYQAGDGIRYNGTHRTMEYFDGSKWVSMTPAWPDVTGGLMGHWKLDETSGSVASDSSGNGYTGAVTGTSFSASVGGANGRALSFDGLDDGIAVTNDAFDNLTAMSVCAWVYRESVSGSWSNLVGKSTDGYNGWNLYQRNSDGRIGFYARNRRYQENAARITMLEGWTHLCGMTNGGSTGDAIQLYHNGLLAPGSESCSGSCTSQDDASYNLEFGSLNAGASHRIRGRLDDVRIYNRVLSAAEVEMIYRMGTPVGSSTALPQGCPNIGDICDDGSVYAGLSLDGNVPMFTTPAHIGGYSFNNGNNTGYVDTVTTGHTGYANTLKIVALDSDSGVSSFQPHRAALACFNAEISGADDWYLPAISELERALTALSTGKHVSVTANTPYSSSNDDVGGSDGRAILYLTSSGSTTTGWYPKYSSIRTLCVRKGPAPRCADPYGLEGELAYNQTYRVVQYCDGARWIAIGKSGP